MTELAIGDVSPEPEPTTGARWALPIALIALTFASTLYVGVGWSGHVLETPLDIFKGWPFAVPLMAILLAHEFGHFIAGRYHRVDVSPPFFIPMPFVLFGTLGAVIRMRSAIQRRDALLDVGASGPLAGMVVALPVLIYGIAVSDVAPLPPAGTGYIVEGRSLLYLGLLHLIKGPIPEGFDIFLGPTALAGWAGLLVTMINLIPVAQLDGGHVAYALLGPKQDLVSERVRKALPLLGIGVGLYYGLPAYLAGARDEALLNAATAGAQWLVWALLLWVMTRGAGRLHPPTGPEPLSKGRRWIAIGTLLLFVLLFMPSWIRIG